MEQSINIVAILTVGFTLASLLGYIAQRIRLPSILGYLLAGFAIGPYSPGFVADIHISEQLAEIGVILMLFGVGLHFKLEDLNKVKRIAIPGAIGQTVIAAITGVLFVCSLGWTAESGIIMGLSIGVASTVVLIRVLSDNNLLSTIQGHIAIGWLIVEDILTVAVLILLPLFAEFFQGTYLSVSTIASTIVVMVLKLLVLAVIMFTWGHKIVEYILTNIARLRSRELFTLTVLALTLIIATGSAVAFGSSIALGAFIAGMVIGQTDVRHQASANSLPLKDVFAVVFFLSVGMLFNPITIVENFKVFIGILAIILIVKPLSAVLIMLVLRYPLKASITVAIALAQIGEFSFILAEEAMRLKLFPEIGYDVLVACALVSISLNPILFKILHLFDDPNVKNNISYILKATFLKRPTEKVIQLSNIFENKITDQNKVVIVGFGPIGQAVADLLESHMIKPIIIEQNIDSVPKIKADNRHVIYGDASHYDILEAAKIKTSKLLIITVPEIHTALSIIKSTQHINPDIQILTRITYLSEQSLLETSNIDTICSEKEMLKAFMEKINKLLKGL